MSKFIIKDFKGLNSSIASLQLKPGEVPFSQNFRGRPYTNYARRQGVDPVSTQSGAVLGIFEIDLDGVTIPLIQSPNVLTFNPPIQSPNFPITGDIYPPQNPLDPTHVNLIVFDLEQAMRAIQDRRVVAGHITWDWPNIRFDINGNRINQAVGNYPATGTYRGDISYDDFYNGNPIGTKAASLVNQILAACLDTVGLGDWIKTIEGLSSVLLYDSTIFPTSNSATAANYRSVYANTKVGIRKLITIQKGAQQTVVEHKTGTAQDVSDPCYTTTTFRISGYADGQFVPDPLSSCGVHTSTGQPLWDGSFVFQVDLGSQCLFEADLSGSGNYSISGYRMGNPTLEFFKSATADVDEIEVDFDITGFESTAFARYRKTADGNPRGTYNINVAPCMTTYPASITIV